MPPGITFMVPFSLFGKVARKGSKSHGQSSLEPSYHGSPNTSRSLAHLDGGPNAEDRTTKQACLS